MPTADAAANPVFASFDLDGLAFALAFNYVGEKRPIPEVLARHGITIAQFLTVKDAPLFKQSLHKYEDELRADGTSFKLKARIQAEALLTKNWELIHSQNTPAAIALKGIENVVRWAGLEPKKDEAEGTSRPSISITIDLGDRKEEVVIEHRGQPDVPAGVEEKRDAGGEVSGTGDDRPQAS